MGAESTWGLWPKALVRGTCEPVHTTRDKPLLGLEGSPEEKATQELETTAATWLGRRVCLGTAAEHDCGGH